MGKFIDLTGQRFGKLVVLYRNGTSKNKKAIWHCKCDCGTECDVLGENLKKGNTKSCGCLVHLQKGNKYINLVGKHFGKLTVLYENGKTNQGDYIWHCKCDCGNEVDVKTSVLKNGSTKSCGCYRAEQVRKALLDDITGRKFGRLTVLYENGHDNNNIILWHCKCDCGNEVNVRANHLKSGSILSCGCYANDVNRKRLITTCFNNRVYPQWFIDELYYEKDKKRAENKTMTSKEHVYFNCKEHGKYKQAVSDHITLSTGERRCGCPVCASHIISCGSSSELEIKNYIKKIDSNITISKSKILEYDGLRKKEIDIYLPEHNIGIEYNGSVFHATIGGAFSNKEKNYHRDKFLQAKKQGVHLLNIFDVDWDNNKDKIKMYIKDCLTASISIFARKCIITEIDCDIAFKFEEKYHIQGGNRKLAKINYGLYYNNELMAVMSFGNLRMSKTEDGQYELHRYCVKGGYTILGGAEKLLKHFERKYNPMYIRSYSDNDYFTGDIYTRLGFTNSGQCRPRYYWFYKGTELKRESCQLKNLRRDFPELLQEAYDKGASNKEDYVMTKLHASKVYRSGNTKWEKSYKG